MGSLSTSRGLRSSCSLTFGPGGASATTIDTVFGFGLGLGGVGTLAGGNLFDKIGGREERHHRGCPARNRADGRLRRELVRARDRLRASYRSVRKHVLVPHHGDVPGERPRGQEDGGDQRGADGGVRGSLPRPQASRGSSGSGLVRADTHVGSPLSSCWRSWWPSSIETHWPPRRQGLKPRMWSTRSGAGK